MNTLTADDLKARLATLEDQYQHLVNDINAVGGAIQLCQQLLQELENPPVPAEKPPALHLVPKESV